MSSEHPPIIKATQIGDLARRSDQTVRNRPATRPTHCACGTRLSKYNLTSDQCVACDPAQRPRRAW